MKTYYELAAKFQLEMPPLIRGDAGVYSLHCKGNAQSYIGCSKHLLSRLKEHVAMLRKNTHSNAKLQRAWNKYGEESFTFCVLQYTEDIYTAEKNWVAMFGTHSRSGMNLTAGGDGCWLQDKGAERRRRTKITEKLRTPEVRKKIGDWSRKHWSENYEAMCKARSEAAKRQWAKKSAEERSMQAKKAWAGLSEEERTARLAKTWATRKARGK